MGSRMPTDERRAQLIALALELFAKRSYEELSIDEIAREAGISKGLLYHYFPSKRAFFIAAVEAASAHLLEATMQASDDPDPEVAVRAGIDAYLGFVEERKTVFRFLMRGGMSGDVEVRRILDGARDQFVNELLEGVRSDGKARVAACGLVGFIEAASLEWVENNAVARDDLATLLTQTFLLTLAPFALAP